MVKCFHIAYVDRQLSVMKVRKPIKIHYVLFCPHLDRHPFRRATSVSRYFVNVAFFWSNLVEIVVTVTNRGKNINSYLWYTVTKAQKYFEISIDS